MSLIDQYFKNVPEYYDTMYADGFTPEQILYAKRRQMAKAEEEQKQFIRETLG